MKGGERMKLARFIKYKKPTESVGCGGVVDLICGSPSTVIVD